MQHAAWDGEPTPSGRWRGAAEPGPAFVVQFGALLFIPGVWMPTSRRSFPRIEVFTRSSATSKRGACDVAKWRNPFLAIALANDTRRAARAFGVAIGSKDAPEP